jgi:hypothetical protein
MTSVTLTLLVQSRLDIWNADRMPFFTLRAAEVSRVLKKKVTLLSIYNFCLAKLSHSTHSSIPPPKKKWILCFLSFTHKHKNRK